MTFGEFWRKYKVLSESANSLSGNLNVDQVRSAVQDLLEELDLDKTAVRLGNTQVRIPSLQVNGLNILFRSRSYLLYLINLMLQ